DFGTHVTTMPDAIWTVKIRFGHSRTTTRRSGRKWTSGCELRAAQRSSCQWREKPVGRQQKTGGDHQRRGRVQGMPHPAARVSGNQVQSAGGSRIRRAGSAGTTDDTDKHGFNPSLVPKLSTFNFQPL